MFLGKHYRVFLKTWECFFEGGYCLFTFYLLLLYEYLINKKKGENNMTTIQLQQSVLQDVVSLLDDKEAMKKLQKVLQRLKQEKAAKQEMTDKDKAEILNDIKEGLHELKLMKQGKLKSRPVEELLDEI